MGVIGDKTEIMRIFEFIRKSFFPRITAATEDLLFALQRPFFSFFFFFYQTPVVHFYSFKLFAAEN